MYHLEYPITPSQEAVNGSLEIYAEGGKKDDLRQMLFGLAVLRHATEAQLRVAMPLVEGRLQLAAGVLEAMLAL